MTEVLTFTPSGEVLELVGGGIPGPPGRDGEAAQVAALGSFYAALARRTSPTRILFLGSSSTWGANASIPELRWVNLIIRRLQASYPSITGTEAPVTTLSAATASPNANAGVQGLNGGISGATSATYYSSGTLYGTGILNPDLAVHMIGSNDSTTGEFNVPVGAYKTNVLTAINALDTQSQTGTPLCHLLIHTYRRFGVSIETWQAYGRALREIADSKENVAFLDISKEYELSRHISPDPYNLIDTDIVHQTDSGHLMMADIVARFMGFPPMGPGVHYRVGSASLPAGLAPGTLIVQIEP